MLNQPENTDALATLLFADAASFERIFKDHYAALCRVAFRVLRNEEKAEDVVQDLFARLWETREGRTISVSPKTYLTRAAVNAAIDYQQKHRKLVNPTHEQWQQLQPAANSTDEAMQQTETQAQIAQALNKLPPACRTVFVLSREEELSYKEIADALQISVKTVENQMGKALKIMRQELLPYLGGLVKLLVPVLMVANNIFS